ncbi:MAG: hypothetical protein ACK46L_12940 [Synechococcaceae cyanobacterium]
MTSPAISSSSSPLNQDQLEDLQAFIKDWLRHTGRTQADLRRALRAASIRMPVLLEALQDIHQDQGLLGMVDRLCSIEAIWQDEDQGGDRSIEDLDGPLDSFGQLDLLLQEIREDRQD